MTSANPLASILALAARSNNSAIGTAPSPMGLPGDMVGGAQPKPSPQNDLQGAIQRRMKKRK